MRIPTVVARNTHTHTALRVALFPRQIDLLRCGRLVGVGGRCGRAGCPKLAQNLERSPLLSAPPAAAAAHKSPTKSTVAYVLYRIQRLRK